eukprot:GILI01027547.1.p1 GENE.GILI01027547.1~~GILI01027547.1.p1  ORF type:complete len:260 (-),score=58.34 GILI01027547.1:215-994(-)
MQRVFRLVPFTRDLAESTFQAVRSSFATEPINLTLGRTGPDLDSYRFVCELGLKDGENACSFVAVDDQDKVVSFSICFADEGKPEFEEAAKKEGEDTEGESSPWKLPRNIDEPLLPLHDASHPCSPACVSLDQTSRHFPLMHILQKVGQISPVQRSGKWLCVCVVGTLPEAAGQGLSKKLQTLSLEKARSLRDEHGQPLLQGAYMETSSAISYHIAQQLNFQEMSRIGYDEYTYRGHRILSALAPSHVAVRLMQLPFNQ